ncbi:hypothetical protein [Rhizomicrobium electricum]|jgi:hypothetical protein|uniref:Uncharacterized protein n=1 Tax=Rhizomicrobium electricum TaxID=480070 RepID=A0ABN1F934_9PROT|nr:hypothetical protein [Rhizomicrobium electricum]NIJ46829.1 hypothetical protein [Rhizomicrobium electricum]
MIETSPNPVARATEMLVEEMEAAHAAFVRIQRHIEKRTEIDGYYVDRWMSAARLMALQVAAANALNHLSGQRDGFTFTYIHQGPPSRGNVKTNVPVRPALNDQTAETDAETEDQP